MEGTAGAQRLSASRAFKPGSPPPPQKKVPWQAPSRAGAVEGGEMPSTPPGSAGAAGDGDPALLRRLPARKEGREERKRRRQMGSDGNIS